MMHKKLFTGIVGILCVAIMYASQTQEVVRLKSCDGCILEVPADVVDQSPTLGKKRSQAAVAKAIKLSTIDGEILPVIVCALEVMHDVRSRHPEIADADLRSCIILQIEEGIIPVEEYNFEDVLRAAQELRMTIFVEALMHMRRIGFWQTPTEGMNGMMAFDDGKDFE